MKKARPEVKQTRAVLVRFAQREYLAVAHAAAARDLRITDFCRGAIRVAAGTLPVRPPEPPR
jgi:hypothetical protein